MSRLVHAIGQRMLLVTPTDLLYVIELYRPVVIIRPLLIYGGLARGQDWIIYIAEDTIGLGVGYQKVTLIHELLHLFHMASGFHLWKYPKQLNLIERYIDCASKRFTRTQPLVTSWLWHTLPRRSE